MEEQNASHVRAGPRGSVNASGRPLTSPRLVILLLASVAIAAIAAIIIIILIARNGLDHTAIARDQTILAAELSESRSQLRDISQSYAPQLEQDLQQGGDGASILSSSVHVHLFALMSGTGDVLSAAARGTTQTPSMRRRWQALLLPLMRDMLEAQYAAPVDQQDRFTKDTVIVHDGLPYLVSATMLRMPSTPHTDALRARPVAIVAEPIDAEWLKVTSNELLMRGMRFSPDTDRTLQATLPLATVIQGAPGYLTWDPGAPGAAFAGTIIIPVMLMILVLLGLTGILAVYARRATESLVNSEQRTRRMAYEDGLTSLPNRSALVEALGADDNATQSPGAMLLLDIDHFKEVNDTLGHPVGDKLIVEVGARLRKLVNSNDVVGRLGGDEFAVVIRSAISDADALDLGERIVTAMSQPFHVAGTELHLSASLGVCLRVDGATLTDPHLEYLRRADVALYRAKSLGRSRAILFDPQFDVESLQRKQLQNDLRGALATNAITLAYQPQFEAATMKMTGVEALARWRHPVLGPVAPDTFIAIAEETGLIRELGRQVLEEAIAQARRWPGLSVAINVSALQVRDPEFVTMLSAMLEKHRVPAEQIEIEITESVLLDENARIAERLLALKALGFRLALDDFGTGFSSLRYLSRYHFDKIKIDRGFIADANSTVRAMGVLRSVAAIGHMTGMKICAEGVESKDQFALVTDVGCTEVQGFYFMKPQLAQDIDALLAGRRDNIIPFSLRQAG